MRTSPPDPLSRRERGKPPGGGEVLPLRRLRVINFGWIWAAPALCGALADMGAEVIKVETRRRVDNTRISAACYKDIPEHTHSSLTLLRGQRSVTLDLGNPESTESALRLVSTADIAVENYRPGTFERWGLGYRALRRVKPDIIMVSLSAGGQSGPLRNITTFGSTLSCLTGLDSIQGYLDGKPAAFGTAHIDPYNAFMGLTATLAALRHRDRTGQGQHIDLAQWEATATMYGAQMLDYQWNGRIPGPLGNRDPAMAPHGVYPCQGDDSWIAIAVETQEQWRALRRVMGNPAWARAPRFADGFRRLRRQDELDARLAEWTRSHETFKLTAGLQAAGVPAFPAMSDREAFTDRHVIARDGWVEVEHPYGPMTVNGIHWRLSKTPGRLRRSTAMLGQDNDYVFRELLALDERRVAELEGAGAIA